MSKSSPTLAGPFPIKLQVSQLAYELDLPIDMHIHPVISIAHLDPWTPDAYGRLIIQVGQTTMVIRHTAIAHISDDVGGLSMFIGKDIPVITDSHAGLHELRHILASLIQLQVYDGSHFSFHQRIYQLSSFRSATLLCSLHFLVQESPLVHKSPVDLISNSPSASGSCLIKEK